MNAEPKSDRKAKAGIAVMRVSVIKMIHSVIAFMLYAVYNKGSMCDNRESCHLPHTETRGNFNESKTRKTVGSVLCADTLQQ